MHTSRTLKLRFILKLGGRGENVVVANQFFIVIICCSNTVILLMRMIHSCTVFRSVVTEVT